MALRTTRANSEYLTVASSTMNIPGNNAAWTFYAKIRTPSSFSNNTVQFIFSMMTTPGGIDINLGITINGSGATGWLFGDSNAVWADTTGTTSVATSTDYDVALTFNPSDTNNEYRLYVDGTNVATTAKGTSQDCSDAWLARWSANSHHFDGLMKAVKAWDGALSADELIGESKKMLPVRQADILWILPLIEKSDGSEPSMLDLKQGASWTSFNTPTSETGAPMAYGAPSGFVIAPATAGAQTISGVGAIATAEAFGTPQLNLALTLTGITSAEAFGSPTMVLYVDGAGAIATAEAFGTPSLHFTIGLTGITSAEAFGSPTLTIYVDGAGGIATAEAFGTPDVAPTTSVELAGIGTAEAFGTPALHFSLGLAGIASAEAFGVPVFTLYVDAVGAIASAEAFGSPVVSFGLQLAGITSTEAFGVPALGFTLLLSGIASAEVFGATIVVGGVQVQPSTLNTFTLTGEVPAFPLAAHSGAALLTGERIVPIEVGE